MRNANGTGSITKLSGNRRKPYAVIVTTGFEYDEVKDSYKQKRKYLGYYSSQQEARKALADYLDNPYDVSKHDVTVDCIWNTIKPRLETQISASRMDCYNSAYKYLEPLKNAKLRDIRTQQLQTIIDGCDKKSTTKQNIKTVMSKIYEYAMMNDYVSKDYSKYVNFTKDETSIKRKLYTEEEIAYLWNNVARWECAMTLILLYSGMRINEFISNKAENVDLVNKTITIPKDIAKNVTSARVIPIHDKILPLLEAFKNIGSEWIAVKPGGNRIIYKNYMSRERKSLDQELGTTHTPHDTRHTFTTQARQCGLDNLIIQRLVGHAPETITESVYTHITIEELRYQLNFVDYV